MIHEQRVTLKPHLALVWALPCTIPPVAYCHYRYKRTLTVHIVRTAALQNMPQQYVRRYLLCSFLKRCLGALTELGTQRRTAARSA